LALADNPLPEGFNSLPLHKLCFTFSIVRL
jgi:hypothetical protein